MSFSVIPPSLCVEYRQNHATVIDRDVGMVIGGFAVGNETLHERHRLRKPFEDELFLDCVAGATPAFQGLEMFLNLRVVQQCHCTTPRRTSSPPCMRD